MKYEKWIAGVIAVAIALCLTLGSLGCLSTAFSLPTGDLTTVMFWCGLLSASLATVLNLKKWRFPALCLVALALGYFTRKIDILLQLEALVYHISVIYDSAYRWGSLRWTTGSLANVPMTWGLILIGWLICLVTVWTLCRRKSAFGIFLVALLPLGACLVVTDTVPHERYLFLLLFGLLLVLLTQSVRRRSCADGNRLTAVMLIPSLLASMLLFAAAPKDQYAQQTETLQQTVLGWLQSLPFVTESPNGQLTVSFDGSSGDTVYLSSVGPKTSLRYKVMDVVSTEGGILYLRGQAYDTYSGTTWTTSSHDPGADRFWPNQNLEYSGTVTVTTRTAKDYYLFPYYPFEDMTTRIYADGKLKNPDSQRQYTFDQYVPMEGAASTYALMGMDNPYKQAFLVSCTRLPDVTRIDANRLLSQLPLDGLSIEETATAIAQYVCGSASYDLNTPRMPDGRKDFAMWFLQESDTGYCTHFASAAAVLLRAAGIPARYVTGYLVNANENANTVVNANSAHAWVEYFDISTGWQILEATPADPSTDIPGSPTEPPTEVPTQPPTEAPTAPPDTTRPQQPTEQVPQQTQPDTPSTEPSKPGFTMPGWLKISLTVLAWLAVAVTLILGQYWLRRRLWKHFRHRGTRNAQAIVRWKEVRRMCRVLKTPIPEELQELAEKAMFSQHMLKSAELVSFDLWLETARRSLVERPWYYRILCKLIFAVE